MGDRPMVTCHTSPNPFSSLAAISRPAIREPVLENGIVNPQSRLNGNQQNPYWYSARQDPSGLHLGGASGYNHHRPCRHGLRRHRKNPSQCATGECGFSAASDRNRECWLLHRKQWRHQCHSRFRAAPIRRCRCLATDGEPSITFRIAKAFSASSMATLKCFPHPSRSASSNNPLHSLPSAGAGRYGDKPGSHQE